MPRELPVTSTTLPVKSYLIIANPRLAGSRRGWLARRRLRLAAKRRAYLFGYGFDQNTSPLKLNEGRTSIDTSPSTLHWQESRISSSWPMMANEVFG